MDKMSVTVDYIKCPNCGEDEATRETDNKTQKTSITCTACGYDSNDRLGVCPVCTAGLAHDSIIDNCIVNHQGDWEVHYAVKCMSDKCDYEGYERFKLTFLGHIDEIPVE